MSNSGIGGNSGLQLPTSVAHGLADLPHPAFARGPMQLQYWGIDHGSRRLEQKSCLPLRPIVGVQGWSSCGDDAQIWCCHLSWNIGVHQEQQALAGCEFHLRARSPDDHLADLAAGVPICLAESHPQVLGMTIHLPGKITFRDVGDCEQDLASRVTKPTGSRSCSSVVEFYHSNAISGLSEAATTASRTQICQFLYGFRSGNLGMVIFSAYSALFSVFPHRFLRRLTSCLFDAYFEMPQQIFHHLFENLRGI